MDPFEEHHNTFFDAAFGNQRSDIATPETEMMQGLGSISGLYLYINPPPMGYGTPAPKVAETINRTRVFNLKPNNREIKIDRFTIENTVWDLDLPFNTVDISSNWHPSHFHIMCKNYLKTYHTQIDNTAEETIDYYLMKNSDVLTKGRQTWCPISERSIPSAQAMANWCKLLMDNGKPDHHSVIELIQYTFELMNLTELVTREVYYVDEIRRIRSKGKVIKVTKKIRKMRNVIIRGQDNVRNKVLDYMRSFCSYIKHAERAHFKRRAIASPSIPLRALLLVVEEFHLKLGKLVPGSTISIGGDEKKRKIIQEMNAATTIFSNAYSIQGTLDATKWNECLSPQLFGMLTETFFDDDGRQHQGIQKLTTNLRIFKRICKASHFLLAIKRITLGEGLQGISDEFHGKIDFLPENLEKFNPMTQAWFKDIIPYLEDRIYVNSSGGMLMGMHNALSTTVGLVTVGHGIPTTKKICTLRSSDDAMSLYVSSEPQSSLDLIKLEQRNLRFAAINQSKEKNLYFNHPFGEYTSWYHDGKMVSQYGPETTKLRPGGKNPPDDFYGVAKAMAVSQMGCESNELGAEVAIRLGINNVRDLYRIKRGTIRSGVSAEVILLSDGGLNPWNCMNCHLEETSLRKKWARTTEDHEYLYKIRTPDNPFIGPSNEEISWSREINTLAMAEPETPRTIFHFIKRANRSITNSTGENHAKEEKAHAEALRIIQMADMSTILKTPSFSIKSSDHVKSSINTLGCGLQLSEDELRLVNSAMKRLDGYAPEDLDVEPEFEVDFNILDEM